MSNQKTEDHIATINLILIEELDIEHEEALTPSAHLVDDLNADPDAAVFIVVRIEDELLITLPDGVEETFITVQDIYDCVRPRRKKLTAS